MSFSSIAARPRQIRLAPDPLGLYFRVGRNDHRELLDLLAAGEARFFGIVCDPTNAKFQRELVERALQRQLDVILDPRTQASATVGGFNAALGDLPWGRKRIHVEEDFRGAAGRRLVADLAYFVAEHKYTEVFAPSHVLRSTDDAWWEIDQSSAVEFREQLNRAGCTRVPVLYSLAISYAMLRDDSERSALIRGLKDLPVDCIWLAVDGLGSNSTATAVRTYLEAVSEFHSLGLPLIADHAGGLVGLAFAAFGGVGALAHGVTLGERFDTTHWRRPRSADSFGLPRRVYLPTLDLLLKPQDARTLFGFGRRATGLFGCHDSQCCPRGVTDMLENPAQHFLRQRIDEISKLSVVPASMRAGRFVEQRLRPTTDAVLAATKLDWNDENLASRMSSQRMRLDRMRIALGDLAETPVELRSVATVPARCILRVGIERPPLAP